MFVDVAKVYIKGGDGGRGSNAMRREKYIPEGGPWGGNGGTGGSVVFRVDSNLTTLMDFRYRRHFKADSGEAGAKKAMTGRSGQNLEISVPPGTIIKDATSGNVLADLVHLDQQVVLARGGRGGRGNMCFATPVRQAPRIYEEGEPGEDRWITLELKLVADVGLVGYPNAGKSSLLSRVTAARPKVGNYPFTTLSPVLGVVAVEGFSFVLADLPGLIEGAHQGVGLGHEFLRHVERTRVLVQVLDGAGTEGRDPQDDFLVIRQELEMHNPRLAERPFVVAVNKMDLPDAQERWSELSAWLVAQGIAAFAISTATGQGMPQLLRAVAERLQAIGPEPVAAEPQVILRPEDHRAFRIQQESGKWVITGRSIERLVAMTPWQEEEAVERFLRVFYRSGIEMALRRAGAKDGDMIAIRDIEFELHPEAAMAGDRGDG